MNGELGLTFIILTLPLQVTWATVRIQKCPSSYNVDKLGHMCIHFVDQLTKFTKYVSHLTCDDATYPILIQKMVYYNSKIHLLSKLGKLLYIFWT